MKHTPTPKAPAEEKGSAQKCLRLKASCGTGHTRAGRPWRAMDHSFKGVYILVIRKT